MLLLLCENIVLSGQTCTRTTVLQYTTENCEVSGEERTSGVSDSWGIRGNC